MHFTIILATALLSLPIAINAQQIDTTKGAGSYEVYVGSAFKIRQLMDSSAWSYVAKNCDGIWWHPVGYSNTDGYGNITTAEWPVLASYFGSKRAIIEGDMNNGAINGDDASISRTKKLGFLPFASFVNRIPDDSLDAWRARVARNLAAGVQSYTMLAPHRMETLPGGFMDASYTNKRQMILDSYGTSFDAPTHLFINNSEAYRKSIYDATQWTHSNKGKVAFLISPNVDSTEQSFLTNAIKLVHALEDSNKAPDYYAVLLYGQRPTNLVPATRKDAQNRPVAVGTVTGVAHWLLQHARADAGELDLAIIQNGIKDNTNPIVPFEKWTGAAGVFKYQVQLQNKAHQVDFIPLLQARVSGLPAGWTLRVLNNGIDITQKILGTGYLLYRSERLYAGQSHTLDIELSKAGETTIPSSLEMEFWVRPQPNSKFIRDHILIRQRTQSSYAQSKIDLVKVTAGGQQVGNLIPNATDNNIATRWTNINTIESAWLRLDPGGTTAMRELRIRPYDAQGRTYPIKVEIENNGNFTEVWSGSTGRDTSMQRIVFSPTVGSALKISMTAPNSLNTNWFGINEIELWGNALPIVSFSKPLANATWIQGQKNQVTVNAQDPDGTIAHVQLSVNGTLVRLEGTAPYDWNATGQNDTLLTQLPTGKHTLQALATDKQGATRSITQTIDVISAPVQINETKLMPLNSINKKNFDLLGRNK